MTSFNDREKAEEAKFALDADLKFKALSRRNKMFADWVGRKLQLDSVALADYVHSILKSEVAGGGDKAIIEKACVDLDAKNAGVARADVSRQLDALMSQAIADIKAGK